MCRPESSPDSVREIVSVDERGRVTIPREFREQLNLDTPGGVCFRKTDHGDIVVEQPPSAEEMIGFTARADSETETDRSATELLREKRAADRRDRDARFDESNE